MAGGPGSYLIGEEEKKEILDVLDSGYLFRYGADNDPAFKHKVKTFEEEFARRVGLRHCVAVTSGTGALLCCLSALELGPGDEVIVPGYTFIASISSIFLSGATPVLAEIDESLTLDPKDVAAKITPRTKAILPVHMLGNPCDMDEILAIARKHGLRIIEDCCQAAGASFHGRPVGTLGDIGAFSLNTYKTITCGDGGMVVTDDDGLYERAFGYHDQGHKPRRMGVEVGNRSILGMNLRMNELSGAVALAQLRKLDTILATLRRNKARLKARLQGVPGLAFRTIHDEAGECATLLTLLLPDRETADRFTASFGSKTLSHSGWHVYNNMEQVLSQHSGGRTYHAHMLPQTDAILDRAVNISVGVVDSGLGSPFGINVRSTDAEIDEAADRILSALAKVGLK